MGRYYCVQFVYNLRFFGKKGSKNIKDYQGVSDRPSGAVGMGTQHRSRRRVPSAAPVKAI